MALNSIGVYCGSSTGKQNIYTQFADTMGAFLAKNNITLVYGGAKVGTMGSVSDACMREGGRVVGVIPSFMKNVELANNQISELIWVESMHERKAKMEILSDAFIILPGSIGTMDEFFEILTWKQLQLHSKPIIIVNFQNYYQPLILLLEQFYNQEFMQNKTYQLFEIVENLSDLKVSLENTFNMKLSDF